MKLERQRYYAFVVKGECECTKDQIERVIWETMKELFGVVGASKSGFYLKEYDSSLKRGIARVSHEFQEEFEAVLARIHVIQGVPVILETILCSGTLKALRKKIL